MILDRIVAHKRKEVDQARQRLPLEILRDRCESHLREHSPGTGLFSHSLRVPGEVALIAEIKKASPSKGIIRPDFSPSEIAKTYTIAGASAISVLTDAEFFQGSPDYLRIAREQTELPLLRKDFIIDPYQIYEARLWGADALLLIMAILTDRQVEEYSHIASSLGLECLVEVHTGEELRRALSLGADIIGINNRNLQTFRTELETTLRLRELINDDDITVVSESGINTRADVLALQRNGIHAMLVGEALMRETDITGKVRELLGILPEKQGPVLELKQ